MNNRGIINDILLLLTLAIIAVVFIDLSSEIRKPRINTRIQEFLETLPNCKIVVTSAGRSPENNRKVGGTKNSLHLQNRAVDIMTNPECRKYIINNARHSGLTVIVYPKAHLHLDNRKKVQCLVKLNKGYTFCHTYQHYQR